MQTFGKFHMLSYRTFVHNVLLCSGDCSFKDARKILGFGFNKKPRLGVASHLDSHKGQGAKVVRSSSCRASWQSRCTNITIDVPWITAVLTWSCSSPWWSHFFQWQETGWTKSNTMAILSSWHLPLEVSNASLSNLYDLCFHGNCFDCTTWTAKNTGTHKAHTHINTHIYKIKDLKQQYIYIYSHTHMYTYMFYAFGLWFLSWHERKAMPIWCVVHPIHDSRIGHRAL